jgi:hypothetical protein
MDVKYSIEESDNSLSNPDKTKRDCIRFIGKIIPINELVIRR